MTQPIYKQFRGRLTEAWYHLTKEEQESLFAKVEDALKQVGGERVVTCDARWFSDEWEGFGIEKFPDIEAVRKHKELLYEIDWYRYGQSECVLGTEMQGFGANRP